MTITKWQNETKVNNFDYYQVNKPSLSVLNLMGNFKAEAFSFVRLRGIIFCMCICRTMHIWNGAFNLKPHLFERKTANREPLSRKKD